MEQIKLYFLTVTFIAITTGGPSTVLGSSVRCLDIGPPISLGNSLDSSSSGALAMSSWGPGRLDIFAIGGDGDMWHMWYDGNWNDWENLGHPASTFLNSRPAATSWGPGRIDIVSLGDDNDIWHKWYDSSDGGWHDWERLSGYLTSAPSVSTWGPGRLDIFALGGDRALWHKWYDGGWNAWESLGGFLTSAPSAVSMDVNRVDIFGRADGDIWHKWYDKDRGEWNPWQKLPVPPVAGESSSPSVASLGIDKLAVFVRAGDGTFWVSQYNRDTESASGWGALDKGRFSSDPTATSPGLNSLDLDIVAKGFDNSVLLLSGRYSSPCD